jgi:uncharacterized phiE125 gp8 family phage protein
MSVPLSTIKSALKIDYDDDDIDLVRLRESATTLLERRMGVLFTPQTRTMYLASFVDTVIPDHPFESLTSVEYTSGGSTVTMPASDRWIDRTQGPIPMLRFLETPAIDEGTAITVTYTAGYDSIPNEIVHALIALVGAWYSNPEAYQPIGLAVVPMSVEFIIDAHSTRSLIR